MPSPFPGMNPWLEARELWPGVHARMIAEISNTISAAIPSRYFVDVEERVYLCEIEDPYVRLIVPDNLVRETQRPFSATDEPAATATITPARQAQLLDPEIRERRIVIQTVDDQSIVTVIEILSPANKLQGSAGRSSYLSKRREVLSSETHFIEIDLLRAGSRTEPSWSMARADYLVWLSRSQDRFLFDYWPTPLESPLPTIPVPLLPGDPDVPLNLQAILHNVYDHSGYVRRLDYTQPAPEPPISEIRMEWLKGFLQPPTP